MFIFLSHNIFSLQIFIPPVLHSLKSYDTTLAILVGTKNENISLERKYFNMFMKILMMVVLNSAFTFSQNYGSWYEIDSMNIARVGHAMVLLPNGNVLVSGSEADSIQSSCEIYEFSTGKWRYTAPMNIPRALHSLVLLSTGKVLAMGGLFERSCEIFDPQTETWTMSDSMIVARNWGGFTITTLQDNRILVAGGLTQDSIGGPFIFLSDCEIFDPSTEKWITVSPMNLGRSNHTATILNDGRVLIAGGNTDAFQTAECELFNPINNTWNFISPMSEPRYSHAAILLKNGNVLLSGGTNEFSLALKSCETYNLNLNQWNLVDDMVDYRLDHQIYFLSEINKLLILGGAVPSLGTEDSWEIYDPDSLTPLYLASFPINQLIVDNNVQLSTENIMVSGGWEYFFNPMPAFSPTKRSWLFDITSDIPQDNEMKINFRLNQNYPNPFNPSTTISYSIQSPSKVELKIFDLLGEEIYSLINDYQIEGEYKINFDVRNLSSGIYYYRLTVTEIEISNEIIFQQTKKMILLR